MPKIKPFSFISNFKKSSIVLIIIALFVVYKWTTGPSGIISQIALSKSNNDLMSQIEELNSLKESLDEERERLRHDTLYLEKIVRSELGMAKPEETVYRLVVQKQNDNGRRESSKEQK